MAWTGVIVLLVVAAATAISVHLGRVAFELTGLPRHKAFFQALSCFTTTGFTTLEAEEIVNHPARRRIATVLMVLGNVGVVAFLAAVVETTVAQGLDQLGVDAAIVAAVVLVAVLVGRAFHPLRFLDRRLRMALMGAFHFEPDPTEQVLSYADGFGVVRVPVREASPVAGRRLRDTHLAARRVIVLAVEREGRNYPIPGPDTRLREGDRLICYGSVVDADRVINGDAPLDARAWVQRTMEVPALADDAAGEPPRLPDGTPIDEDEALTHGYTIMRKALTKAELEGE